MSHISKAKHKTIKLLRGRKTGLNLGDLEFGNKFLNTTLKAYVKLISWPSLKLKISAL